MLDRKIQTRFIGNSLEKPSLALKRNFVKETTYDSEELNEEEEDEEEEDQDEKKHKKLFSN